MKRIQNTRHPSLSRPVMVWDGECSFCKYWIQFLNKRTENRIDFQPYQEVYQNFPDITREEFRKAVVLIEPDGQAYMGAAAATRIMQYTGKKKHFYFRWYHHTRLFRWLADKTYAFISRNRPFMYKLTVMFWGPDPVQMRPYWVFYLLLIVLFLLIGLSRTT